MDLDYYKQALEGTEAALAAEMKRASLAEAKLAAVRASVADTQTYGLARADDAGRLANRIRSVLEAWP